jgi:hypothetical protein
MNTGNAAVAIGEEGKKAVFDDHSSVPLITSGENGVRALLLTFLA